MAVVSIRQLQPDEWRLLKAIRLRALQTDPNVFGSTYDKEATKTDNSWHDWLLEPHQASFGLFADAEIIGLTSIMLDKNDPDGRTAILFGSWIEPAYRRQGVSQLLYQARLQWAQDHPTCERIVVSHRESNLSSKFANQKHGFVFTHRQPKDWPDGTREDELLYELIVKPSSRATNLPITPSQSP